MKKTLRIFASTLVLVLIGYFYVLEFKKNWAALHDYKLSVHIPFLLLSLLFLLMSYLLETYIWKLCIDKHLRMHKLTFLESISIVNASSLLKCLPGRIWMYTAQLAWLKKYTISNSRILHSNLICIIGSMTVSLYLGFLYLISYTDILKKQLMVAGLVLLVLMNLLYITCNSALLNKVILSVNRYFRKEIEPLTNSVSLLVYIQLLYAVSWILTGFAGYCLARGVGLHIAVNELFALLASMALSWLVGYLAFIAPGGLGIREGFMLLMLNQVMNVQTALLFPIFSRIMFMVAEALLGLLAIFIGIKLRVFSPDRSPGVATDA